jgi:hypothetical protein
MFLDLNQGDQAIAARPQPNEQVRLPATFGEGFEASWRENQLFGQSVSGETARQQALSDHIDDVRQRTGVDLAKDIDWSGASFGGALTADMLRETINATARKAGQPELSADDLDQAAVAKSRAARSDYALMAAREKASGGGAGFLLGGLAGAATDPINLLALPVAPAEGLPLLAYALRWGAIAGASQAAIEVAGAPYREAVQPGYAASGEPLANVATATGGGALLGAGTKLAVTALARAWGRVKTGEWPTSVRDAGNVAESEANIQATNVYPGAAGEAAHRDALATAIDQVVDGRQVQVSHIVTGSILEDYERQLVPAMDSLSRIHEARNLAEMERLQTEAKSEPELPFEQSARQQAVAGAVDDLSGELQKLSQSVGTVIAPDEARQLAERISHMSADEAAGALDQFMVRPNTLRETLPSPAESAQARRAATAAPPEPRGELGPEAATQMLASPEHEAALRADVERATAMKDVRVPDGVDKNGEPIWRSADSAMAEVDGFKAAADTIRACTNPAPEAEAAE